MIVAAFPNYSSAAERPKDTYQVTILTHKPAIRGRNPTAQQWRPTKKSFWQDIVIFWDNIIGQGPHAVNEYVDSLGTPIYPYHSGTGAETDPKTSMGSFSAYILAPDVLFPGSLIQGDSKLVTTGKLSAIGLAPNGGTVTLTGATFADPNAVVFRHIDDANQPNIAQSIADLVSQPFAPDQFGTVNTNFYRVFSEEQARLDLDASFSGFGADVSAFYHSASDTTQNHIEFSLQQIFFAISYLPDGFDEGPSSFFAVGTTLNDVKDESSSHVGNDSIPLYISSIGYGRALYFMASCSSSMDDMDAALHAAYSSATSGGSVDVSDSQKRALSQCQIQALAVGGSAAAAEPVLTIFSGSSLGDNVSKALIAYITKGMDFGTNSPTVKVSAQPIWYKLNYLSNAQPATVDVSLHFDSKPVPPVTYSKMRVIPTICGDDKEKETPVRARVVGNDGTIYFDDQIFSSTPCGDNSCNGTDFYWGTHGQTYDVIPDFSLSTPMKSYMASDATIDISGPGDTWEARFVVVGVTASGDRKQLLSTGCFKFNGDNASNTGAQRLSQ